MRDWSVPSSVMLACEECRAQEVEASFTVDCHSYTIAENFWVTQARLAHAILHEARVRAVHHCRREQKTPFWSKWFTCIYKWLWIVLRQLVFKYYC